MFNIVNFGAIPDGKTINTAQIQAAIDACHAAGGGQVVVPAGVFKTGTLWLRSNVELYLCAGAYLEGSRDPEDYTGWQQRFG